MNDTTVINLTTGHEDADKVTVAFLVATAALSTGRRVAMFLTKEAVRLALPGYADAVASAGAPPIARLFSQFAEVVRELPACPIGFNARGRDESQRVGNARLAGATPLFEWIGGDPATVFSY